MVSNVETLGWQDLQVVVVPHARKWNADATARIVA
jgi:hypothetical protein